MRSGSRLARMESVLSPKQMVMLEVQSMLRHPDIVTSVREDVVHRLSGPTLCDRIEQMVRKSAGKIDSRVLASRIRGAQREGLFLARLFTECNCSMQQHLREWELETALVHAIAALRAGAILRGTANGALDEVLCTVETCKDAYQAQLRAAHLVGCQYFDGLDICFSDTKAQVQRLIDRLHQLSLAHRESAKGKGKARIAKDEAASKGRIDELARRVARRWITFVRAQVHGELGETSKAQSLAIELMTGCEEG